MDDGLIFPGSQKSELEFRDGKRTVPAYIAAIMAGLETHRMTYEEALTIANRRMESNFISERADAFIAAHFRENR